jgi:GMP synthase-like glutamine amidotransferase
MILIVNVCSEKLHYLEFVKPIEDIIAEDFVMKHYNDLTKEDLEKCDKVIICGTSLKDNNFLSDLEKFDWLKDFEKPVFGICAGFQILGLVFGGKLEKSTEIGYFKEKFSEPFLDLEDEVEVYHLHNNFVSGWGEEWSVFGGDIVQAVKCKEKDIYGVLFHPEVRNKDLIREFGKL